MKTTRLLLPFTYGVNMLALEYAVMLAKSQHAALVPLSLISVSNAKGSKGARLEHIQQSKDFLCAVQHKATKHSVLVEPIEVFTTDVVESIKVIAHDMNCNGILLFVQDGSGILLHTIELKHVIIKVASKHHIVHMPSNK